MSQTIEPLFDLSTLEDPYEYYAQLRESDPVHRIEGTDAYLVTRLDLIHQVAADPAVYSSRSSEFLHVDERGAPGLRSPDDSVHSADETLSALATADAPDHGRQRRILAPIFAAGAIKAREAEFRSLIDGVLDRSLSSGRIEWMNDVAEPLPMVMVTRLLGLDDHVAPVLKEQGYASVELIGGFVGGEHRRELQEKMTELGPVIDAYMAARSGPQRDLSSAIGVCAQAAVDGDLDDIEAFVILGVLLAAGGESTSSLLGTGARILAEQTDLQDRLRADPALIPAFVEEVCRVDPPFRGHYRRVVADTTLAGVDVPAGSRVILAWPAANRDPEAFDHADEIDVLRRNPRQHVGFGWGIHLCIGAPLARLEARVTFEQLLARTSSFSVDASSDELRHHKSLVVRRLVELPLALHESRG